MKFKRLIAFLLSVSMIVGMMPAIVFASETDKDPDEPGTEETSGSESKESSKPQETKPTEPKETEPQETKPEETRQPETEEPKETEPSEPKETVPAESKPSETEEPKATEPSAPEETEPEEQEETIPSDADKKKAKNDGEVTVIDSGKCGDSIEWSLNSEGVLTFTGSGDFDRIYGVNDVPWVDYVNTITKVIIAENITNIPSHAFRNCKKLKDVSIPDTVITIGTHAFDSCTGLTSVTIPEKVTSLGIGIFENCSNLEEIIIKGKITEIPTNAFSNCVSLSTIVFPNSSGVESIGVEAFRYCQSLTDIGLFSNVTSISKRAFDYCSGLKSVVFPNSKIEIKDGAFDHCEDISVVINSASYNQSAFPESAKVHFYYSVDEFQNDGHGTVSAVGAVDGKLSTYGTDVVELTVTPISNYELEKITWISGGKSVDLIPDANGRVVMPDRNSDYTATLKAFFRFAGASGKCGENLEWVLDKNGPLTISGSGAMYDWGGTNPAPWNDYRSFIKEVVISGKATSIGNYAFCECQNLTSITVPDSVIKIGDDAFRTCTFLTSLMIPDKEITIGSDAFKGCSGLTSVVLSKSSYSKEAFPNIPENIFHYYYDVVYETDGHGTVKGKTRTFGTDVIELDIKPNDYAEFDKVTWSITGSTPVVLTSNEGKYVMPDSNSDTTVTIRALFKGTFGKCGGNLSWFWDKNGTLTLSGFGAMYDWVDARAVPWYNYRSSIRQIEISGKVSSIGINAFSGCGSLTSFFIPESVTSIGDSAFCGCERLRSITIPESVTSIGDSAFSRCGSLTSITISEGVTSIGNSTFSGCRSLTSFTIPKGVTSIGKSAFSQCGRLTSITIPEGVTSIGESAFDQCGRLTSITIPEGVTSIGESAFNQCGNLISITIPDSVTSIGDSAFCDCGSLKSITIPEGVTSIGNSAFANCNSLTSITIPEGVTSLGDYAFLDCGNLTSITIPEGVTSIGERAFSGCSSLTSITIPEGVTSLGENAFFDCKNLTSITIPEGVTSIGDNAFENCISITSISISKNTSIIGTEAFRSCNNLQNIYFSGTEAEWDAYKNVLIAGGADLLFAEIHYNYYYIVVSKTQHGKVIVNKSIAKKDERVTITASPDSGYMIDNIEVNGTVIDGTVFLMGEGKAIVTVTFKEVPKLSETIDDGVFEYMVTNANTDGSGTVTLTKYLKQDATVAIPSTVVLKGSITYKVTRIGTKAFYGNTAIKSVSIGSYVTVIDSYAFCGCSNLTKISGGSRVQAIGSYAFANCARLSSFTVTSSALKKIGYYAFNKDKKLKTIYIRNTTKLSKSGVKKSLKGSSVKTVKVKKSKVKKYKKYFKKSNSGRKVKVKK